MPSNIIWRGDAPAIAQTSAFTITGDDATTTYKVTCGGETVSVLGTGSGVNATATALAAALVASTIAQFLDITWTVSTATITGTATIPGVPFTITKSVSGGSGTIGSITTVAGQGPNDANIAANYSTGALPTTGDTLYLTASSSSLLWNLSSLSAVTLAARYIDSTFTGSIGLPSVNVPPPGSTNGAGGYYEYRPTYLVLPATLDSIGQGVGAGSNFLQLDYSSVQTAVTVYGTATPQTQGTFALRLKGSNASNTLSVLKGVVGIGVEPADTTTQFTVVEQTYVNQPSIDTNITVGVGVTLTTVNTYGGVFTNLGASVTTHNVGAGATVNVGGAAACTTLGNQGGTVNWNSTGTITIYRDNAVGTLNLAQNAGALTITNATILGTLNDPNRVATHTNKPSFPNGIKPASAGGATLNWGTNVSLGHS